MFCQISPILVRKRFFVLYTFNVLWHTFSHQNQFQKDILTRWPTRYRKVACETFVSTGLAVIGGEVRSDAYVDIQHVARGVIEKIGYTKADYMFDSKSCGILSAVHEQSPDINRGVVREEKKEQGAGDQGMMFGYACNDTEEYMPLPLTLAHIALIELAKIRRENPSPMPYLRPDAKSQFTIEYSDDHRPLRVHTIVISTQHDDFPAAEGMVPGTPENDAAIQARIREDIEKILIPRIIARLPERTRQLFDGIRGPLHRQEPGGRRCS